MDPVKVRERKSDTHIMDELIHYLDNTPEGAKVHVNIYLFNYQPLLNAVRKAEDRGVEIHALVDFSRDASKNTNENSIPYLEANLESPSEVISVKSDVTSSSINHNKSVLFSEIDLPEGKAENVVFTTSHNFTDSGTKKIQDAVVKTNKSLYEAFLRDWEKMKSHAQSGMKNHEYTVENIGDSIRVHFFPRRKNGKWDGKDTYLEILEEIKDYSHAEVRVIMSDWTRTEVADKLTELEKEGVDVKVITKDKDGNSSAIERLQKMVKAGGELHIVPMAKMNTHSKLVLIKGELNGKPLKWVITGTHNFTYNALKNNNEVLLELKNSSLFKGYWDYFDELESKLIFK